ncbi:MAG: alpha-L-fucosidase [Puniceicoccaceae bacterium]
MKLSFSVLLTVLLVGCLCSPVIGESVIPVVRNPGFESGNLAHWNSWRTRRAEITDDARSGKYAVRVGPELGICAQELTILPNSRYRLSAWVKTETGSEEAILQASDFGGPSLSVSSALTEYTRVSLEFSSAFASEQLIVSLRHTDGPNRAYFDDIELTLLGEAPPPQLQEMLPAPDRPLLSEGGVQQLPDEALEWYLDARFGMFIHWGVYSAMDEGNEWVMHNKAYPPEYYRQRAEDPEEGFTADAYDPAEWAELAKKAGMKYMVLTARHHDGYALFDSQHPNSWTSVKHLGRDLIREYTDAVREAGLHVGLYYSPMSWRYPGYYNVTGDYMLPNVWNYDADPWHKENARLMKEEVYEQVTRLLTNYGPIEFMFWDGAWIGQSINHELEDQFWDTGRYQDSSSPWQIDEAFKTYDESNGRALGIMGLVRKYQPSLIVNERFSWIGDVGVDEGGSATSGPIRNERIHEKCLSLMKGGWGYYPNRPVYSANEVQVFLSSCAVRNMNLLLNVAPDRHGVIPPEQEEVLLETGKWLDQIGEAIHGTRGGPWQPGFGEYGFTYRGDTIYCHVYEGYRNRSKGTFTTQLLGGRKVLQARDLQSGEVLPMAENDDGTITIGNVPYDPGMPVTIIKLKMAEDIYPES